MTLITYTNNRKNLRVDLLKPDQKLNLLHQNLNHPP